MQEFYIYILYSLSSEKYYIGYTTDVGKRVEQHNSTENKGYTSKHAPWMLKCSFMAGTDRGIAMQVERFIKKQKNRKFIEELIKNPMGIEKIAQMLRVPRTRD